VGGCSSVCGTVRVESYDFFRGNSEVMGYNSTERDYDYHLGSIEGKKWEKGLGSE
jgi:hypothetical protein